MVYLMDMIKDQRKQEKAKAGQNLALGIGIGTVLGLGIGIMITPKSGKETMNDIRSSIMNTSGTQTSTPKGFTGNSDHLKSQDTEFAQEYGTSGSQSSSLVGSHLGSSNGISQGNSIIGNMNPAGKITKIFYTNEEYSPGSRTGNKNAGIESGNYEFAKDYSLSGSQRSSPGVSSLGRGNSSVCDNQSNIGTIYSMDNSSYNDAIDESNYTKTRKGRTGSQGRARYMSDTEFAQDYSPGHSGSRQGVSKSTKQSAGSYESSLNYGPSNIQADSNTENKAGGTVSQSEAKSLDVSLSGSRAGKSATRIVSGAGTSIGSENTIGGNARSSALKRSTRASLKNRGGQWTSQTGFNNDNSDI